MFSVDIKTKYIENNGKLYISIVICIENTNYIYTN